MSDTAAAEAKASPYLNSAEAAAYCRLSVNTLYNRRAAGTGPESLPGSGRLLFTRAALDQWLSAKRERRGRPRTRG